jgi:L-iditol 2-dehydrogenase
MKAIVKTKKGPGIEVQDVEIPAIGDNDFLVKVGASSICGTDYHLFAWEENKEGPNWWDQTLKLPVILGHEFSGQVVEVGKNVTSVVQGDRIIASPLMPCGKCATCRAGKSEFCLEAIVGLNVDGAMAEYLRLFSSATIYKLPDHVGYKAAALIEPLCVALHGVEASGIKPGDTAAVFGPGPIGLLTMLLLKAAGASTVFITGTEADKNRLELAEKIGADYAVNVEKENFLNKVKEVTKGEGLDFVFEATGAPSVLSDTFLATKAFGTIVFLGMYAGSARMDINQLVIGNKHMVGSMGYTGTTWKRALALVASGVVKPELIIGKTFPIADGAAAFESLARKEVAKAMLVP